MSADTITTVVENARRVVKFIKEDCFGCYRAVAPLFISEESYQEGFEILQETSTKVLASLEADRLYPKPGYAPKEIVEGHMAAILAYRKGVISALQEFSKLKQVIDRDMINSDACNELMTNLMFALLLRYVGPGANEGNLFKLAIYFAHSRTYLINAMRSC